MPEVRLNIANSAPNPLPAERPIVRMGRALAVVPSLSPTHKAWRRLGFSLSAPFEFMGLGAFDLLLAGCGVRFLADSRNGTQTPLRSAVDEVLERGSGLLGWTWACSNVLFSREVIVDRTGVRQVPDGSVGPIVVPRMLSPAALTLLEPVVDEDAPKHPNMVTGLDHLVLLVSNVDAAADTYERTFGLQATRRSTKERRYAFLKVGDGSVASVIEIVGPLAADSAKPTGSGWGLAFRSSDLDATVRYLRKKRIRVEDPRPAVQGGRIVSLPMQLGGITIAFLEPPGATS